MQAGIKKLVLASIVTVLSIATISIGYKHVTNALETTNRNELYSPNEYNVAVSNLNGYSKIYENSNFEYYYSPSKTILKIVNKKSGFVWSTGADTETAKNTEKNCSNVTQYSDEYYSCAIDVGPSGTGADNENAYAEINELMFFTYYDAESKAKNRETGRILLNEDSSRKVTASLFGHNKFANQWMFKLTYQKFIKNGTDLTMTYDFAFNLRFTFTEDGFRISMLDEDVSGESRNKVEAVYPLPRLGQSGGKLLQGTFIDEDGDGVGSVTFDNVKEPFDNPKTNLDGYIFVPDGSGALIRFDNVKYYDAKKYFYYDIYGDPYRFDFDESEFQAALYTAEPDYVLTKQISMPVWGVAYGNNQDAFVAYATKGSEYFGLVYQGRSTTFEYASIQPRFERNLRYQFSFGSSSSTLMLYGEEIPSYDFELVYDFLQGDGSDNPYPANYVGMALKYRDYLQNNNLIKNDVELVTGPKVDFLICDVKEGLFGYSDVNVTTCDDIVDILTDLNDSGIKNVTSTLYGWQKGGISKAKPWKTKWNRKVGGKKGFKKVVQTASDYGYDINFYQQYGLINGEQVASFNAYCVKALSRDYGAYVLSDTNKPITWWEYVNANVAGNWLNKQAKELSKLGDNVGITTGGITTLLVPDYGKDLSYQDAANAIYQATKEASTKVSLAGDTPNAYLWKNYDSFYNISVYNSQLQCETDSVPFMEIVFGGLINMYAEYSNFSFYDTVSQLKMIDYNLNPSFIISAEENTNIMYTNARDWFSTSYSSYQKIINEICDNVLPYLEMIQGKTLVNRKVIELDNQDLGLYVNTYAEFSNGNIVDGSEVVLAINYLDYDISYEYNGNTYTILASSAYKLS